MLVVRSRITSLLRSIIIPEFVLSSLWANPYGFFFAGNHQAYRSRWFYTGIFGND